MKYILYEIYPVCLSMPLIQNFSWIIYEIASATFDMFTKAFNSEF